MIWRTTSLKTTALLTLSLCLFTVLLTTPWGTRLTISLLNTIDGITLDYKSGSLVRDIELNTFNLNLEALNIQIKDLTTKINFSCAWQKKLCIESIKAGSFSLIYDDSNKVNKELTPALKAIEPNNLFVMPFSIDAKYIEFIKSQIVVNNTVINIEQFTTALEIKTSQFNITKPKIRRLIIVNKENEHNHSNPKYIPKPPQKEKDILTSVHAIFNTLPEIQLPIALTIQELNVNELLIRENNEIISNPPSNTNDDTLRYMQSKLSGTWARDNVNITNFQTSTTGYSITHLETSTQLIPPYKINATLATKIDNFSLWPEIANSTQKISLQGALDDLTFTIASQGSLALQSQGHIKLTHQEFPFDIKLSADKLPMPLSLAQYGKPSSLSLNIIGDSLQQTINLNSQINSYGYKNALLTLAAKHQEGLINLENFTFIDEDSNSKANLHGHIDVQPTVTSWKLFANTPGFTLPQIDVRKLLFPEPIKKSNTQKEQSFIEKIIPNVINGRLTGKVATSGLLSASKWSLEVNGTDVSGTINDTELIIKGDIALDQTGFFSSGELNQGELLILLDKNKLKLQTFNEDNLHVKGQLSITDINHWYKEASGSIRSNFTIKGNEKNPLITLDTKLTELSWQKLYSPSVEVMATYQPFSDHKTQLTVNSEQLEITEKNNKIQLQALALNLSGDLYQQKLLVDWQGDIAGKFKLTGQWHESINQWQSTIEDTTLTYQQMTWRNNKHFSVDYDLNKQQLLIDKHCWQGEGLDVCLPIDATIGDYGDVKLDLNIDLSVIDQLILDDTVQLYGKVSGEIKAHWSPVKPISAMANFYLSPGSIEINDDYNQQKVSQWHQGNISFVINEEKLTSQVQLQSAKNKEIIQINSQINLIDDFPIEADIVLNQFNLQPFQTVINSIVNMQGNLTAKLSINGTLNSPQINGSVVLDDGEILLSQNPNKFENISTELQIKDNNATITGEFFIKDNKATINGQLAWQDGFTMDMNLNAEKLPIVFPPQLMMSISPTLHLSLKEKVLSIDGTLDVLEGSYNIEKLPEGSVSLSDDVIIVDHQGKEILQKTSGIDIKTNVKVNIVNSFEISGQGLQSNLFGQLQISQKEKQPLQIFGRIQSDNGTYQAYGQKLKIDKGEVTFNGPIKNPYLNLQASRHIKDEDIDVGLQITGLVDTLSMKLFSSPTMESPEMLSYLVRGRGLDSGSGNSTAAASMLLSLGVTSSGALLSKLEKIPLISDLQVDTEGEGDTTQATISGYIGNRVYLKYGIGVYEPIKELTVRMYLMNRLWLEIVSGLEQSSDIYYSFDID